MHNVLIALETDLASGIAIRYADQLEKKMRFNMQALHVPDMDKNGPSPGSGWVHKKWEDGVIDNAKKEISKLVKEDLFYCYLTQTPKIIPGEKETVILNEMWGKHYDFFMEGFLHSFEPDRFFEKIDSDLYKKLSCPVIMVKNLINMDMGLQIVGTPETIPLAVMWLLKLLKDWSTKPDILVCHFETSMDHTTTLDNDPVLLLNIEKRFAQSGSEAGTIRTIKGPPGELSLFVRDHALMVSVLPRHSGPMARMLSMSPCPIMLCPEPESNKHNFVR